MRSPWTTRLVLLIEKREDAERMLKLIPERFEEYGLTVHPEKTSLVDFRHPWVSGKKPETFDFLGFTHYWGQTRRKGFAIKKKTAAKESSKNNLNNTCVCDAFTILYFHENTK